MLWHIPDQPGPYDNSLLLEAAHGDRRAVHYGPEGAFHHWGQPAFGYYLSSDDWVIRKHGSLLGDAGVDFVCFDVTNALTYDSTYMKILDIWAEMRAQGTRTPQVTFILWNAVPRLVQHLWDVLYEPGVHSDLWFRWEGLPLLLAPTVGINATLLPHFTFRESWAWTAGQQWFGDGLDRWRQSHTHNTAKTRTLPLLHNVTKLSRRCSPALSSLPPLFSLGGLVAPRVRPSLVA